MIVRYLAAALALAVPAAAASLPPVRAEGRAPLYRDIKDWLIACDNLGSCFAKFDVEDAEAYLSVSRDSGAGAQPTVGIDMIADHDGTVDPRTLQRDGRPFGADLPWAKNAEDGTIRLTGAAAVGFIDALRNAQALGYRVDGHELTVSLDGMTAALRAMDDAQGRAGTVTALIAKGPAGAVPPPPPMPVVHARPARTPLAHPGAFAAAVRHAQAGLLRQEQCEDGLSQYDSAAALNDREAIVVLVCVQGTKHQSGVLFRASRDNPLAAHRLLLPGPPTVDPKLAGDGQYVVDDGFDPKRGTFDESDVGTAMMDCGTSTQWAFDGTAFQLVSFSRADRCAGPPGDLAPIYRARLVVDQAP